MIKKTLAIILALILLIPSFPVYAENNTSNDGYFEGKGTAANPYLIQTADQLAKLAELVNNKVASYGSVFKHFKLTNDIDLSSYDESFTGGRTCGSTGWIPIGNGTWQSLYSNSFSGFFDGGGHTISGLYINAIDSELTGLFGILEKGRVQNLFLQDITINKTSADPSNYFNATGGIAGRIMNNSSIKNCGVTGTVSSDHDKTGGLVGLSSDSKISNSFFIGLVEGNSQIGGIAGSMHDSVIQNSYAIGSVIGKNLGFAVGGLAGTIHFTEIINSYAANTVVGSWNIGGIVGGIGSGNKIHSNAALNPILTGRSNVERIIGYGFKLSTRVSNWAYMDMMINGNNVTGTKKDENGLCVSAVLVYNPMFWKEAANWDSTEWDETVWEIKPGRLPVLKTSANAAVPVWNELYNIILENLINNRLTTPLNTLGANAVSNVTGNGFDLVVNLGRDIIVPPRIFTTLKGSYGTIMLRTGAGVTFSISGGNIPAGFEAEKIDFSLRYDALKAPAFKISEITKGSLLFIGVPMVNNQNFGMIIGQHFNVGKSNAGNYANLFRFNESNDEFEFIGSHLINEKGQVMFGIYSGGDYLLTVTNMKPN